MYFSTGVSEDYTVSHVHTQDTKAAQHSARLRELGALWLPRSTHRWHTLHSRLQGLPVAIMVQACACKRLFTRNTTHVPCWVHVRDILRRAAVTVVTPIVG